MSIKKPSAVESPYITTDTTPTRLASGPVAGGGVNTVAATVSATVGATANSNTSSSGTGSNVSYYTAGIEGVNELATYGRIFSGANVNIILEQPQYITYNQNFTGNGTVGGSNGQIQFNNNGEFAGSPNLTFNGANLAVGGNVTANYFIGNGSQLTGINAGSSNKIFNGNSYANIASADGSLVIGINSGDTWTFAANSRLIAPGGSQWQNQANADAYFSSSVDGYVHLQSFYADSNVASEVFLEHGLVQIIAHSLGANTDYTWTFNDDANLGLPAGSNISDTAGTLVIEANAGSSLTVKATNGNALTRFQAGSDYAQIGLQDDTTGAYQAWAYLETDMANVNTPSAVVILKPGDTGTEVRWTYNANGSVVFPTLTVDLHNGGNTQGQTLQFGDPNQQAFITGPAPLVEGYAAQRLIIQGQYGNTGEGGDVYIWGGDSQVNGGDIKIYAGDADTAGRGGNIHIAGGRGTTDAGEITLEGGRNDDGVGARVDLTGGFGSTGGGNINLTGGFGALTGGNVAITGGISGNGLAEYGNVNIAAGASTWSFKNNGTTEFPNNVINPGNNQPLTLRTQSSGNAYAIMYQSSNSWEAYAEDDTTEADSAYAWIKADLITANTPRVFINNVRGGDGLSSTWTFDDAGNLTLPNGALLKDTSGDSVAFGQGAGADSQNQHAVAIGLNAGNYNQGEDSVAIGWDAGANNQVRMGIAIGWNAGNDNQGQNSQAYGQSAGAYYQQSGAVAMGLGAGRYLQGQEAVAIGQYAGYGGLSSATVASMPSPDVVRIVGSTSSLYNGMTVVGGSITPGNGLTIVGLSGEDITLSSVPAEPLTNGDNLNFYPAQASGAVAIGGGAGQTLQAQNAVAVGYRAGQTRQGNSSVSIGEDAGYITQAANSVAIGSAAGFDNQGTKAISIGLNAGRTTQGNAAIAMGWTAGQSNQGIAAVSIGEDAGYTTQGNAAVALGLQAGYDTQGANAVAIGYTAGLSAQGNVAIAIGMDAGQSNQGIAAIAMGWGAGQGGQGNAAVAIGEDAGFTNQGEYSVAIGYQAGYSGQGNNSIVLNASGDQINGITANSFTVKPIRNASTGNVLYYDQQSGEITFDAGGSGGLPLANGTSNINIATANSNVTITANSTQTWTFGADGNLSVPGAISAVGNITVGNILTAGNIINSGSGGDITLTSGNITGAVNISATGNVTAANFFGNGNTLSNVATTFESTWTVPTGNSTQSFTVTPNNTYYMWVDCNITNGILTWNATATVTNTNVPVVGAQYAWVYNGGGTPIDFTSIPNQFTGTANTIVRSSVAPSATTNRFDFGINNTSGNSQTVRYGWAQIS